jgi:hypothetical protein
VNSDFGTARDYRRDDEDIWQKVHEQFCGTAPRPANERAMALRSKVTMKITRTKVAAAMARHREIGFKWDLKPTKQPTLLEFGEKELKSHLSDTLASMRNQPLASIIAAELSAEDLMDSVKKLAIDRAARMKGKIEDDFQEMLFPVHHDEGLAEFCLYGTMIFKGPLTKSHKGGRFSRRGGVWSYFDSDGLVTYRPEVVHVSCWDWYPSPGAWCVEKLDYAITRHVLNSSEVYDYLDKPGFFKENVMRVIRTQEGKWVPETWEQGIQAANTQQDPSSLVKRQVFLEWWGFMTVDELEKGGGTVPKKKKFNPANLAWEEVDYDPDEVVIANIWTCGNAVLKASVAPLQPKRLPFYVAPYEKVPKKLFGQGIAWMMSDWAAVLNTVYRAMMDNMGASALPIGWYDKSRVKDQDMILRGGTMFASEDVERSTLPPVSFFSVPNTTPYLRQIAEIANKNIQESTSMPDTVTPPTASGIHRTSSGLSMLGSWSDAPTRNVQRNIDRYVTEPLIRSMYFWNMQWATDDTIKGDFEVVAMGAESVMADEVMTERVVDALGKIAQDPEAAKDMDKRRIYRWLFDKLGFKEEGFIYSDEEKKRNAEQEQAMQVQTADQIAQAQARYQPQMSEKDAALKFFGEIPDTALAMKIAVGRKVGPMLGVFNPGDEADQAAAMILGHAAEHAAATPTESDYATLEAINAGSKLAGKTGGGLGGNGIQTSGNTGGPGASGPVPPAV